ncbi:MAG TPA: RICIN domain-containing protein [Pyrinomonadaceae bacterium]
MKTHFQNHHGNLRLDRILCLAFMLLFGNSVEAQTAFSHTANSGNISFNSSYLDHPELNGNSNKAIQVTSLHSNNQNHVGVWFDRSRNKWAIFNQSRAPMRAGTGFHVVIADGFIHRAQPTNILSNYTIIDSPFTNNNPSALLFVTQNYNPAGASEGIYNNHSIGVFYTAGKWAIFNQDRSAMPPNAAFNVHVSGGAESARVLTSVGEGLNGRIPVAFARRDNVLLVTSNWNPNGRAGVYNNGVLQVGIEPDSGEWMISSNSINPPRGAAFNVVVFASRNNIQNSLRVSETLPPLLKQRVVVPKQRLIRLLPNKNFAGIFVVKFVEGSHVRRRENRFVSDIQVLSEKEISRLQRSQLSVAELPAQLDQINEIIRQYSTRYGFQVAEMFQYNLRRQNPNTQYQDPNAQFYEKERLELVAGEELADLDLYYIIAVPNFRDIDAQERFMNELNSFKIFEEVQAAFLTENATVRSSGNIRRSSSYGLPPPDLSANQGYLNAAPEGIDARYGWTIPGGRGQDVKLIDVEYDWVTDHEDFAPGSNRFWGRRPPAVPCVYDGSSSEHGTAVMGVLNAPHNSFGINGIAPDIGYGLSSICRPLGWLHATTSHEALFTLISGENIAGRTHNLVTSYAIDDAAAALRRGDILLIEQHAIGPSSGLTCSCNCEQWEYVPMEYYQHSFDAIKRAAVRGIAVVEAAGNGGQNLDATHYNGRFDPSRYSAALLVGASNGNGDNNRACFSNFGRRVDVHGWGDRVATLGYGKAPDGSRTAPWYTGEIPRQYTASFGGTSSASPIVAGAIASIQGARKAAALEPLYPAQLRTLFISTGTPQGAATASENIGPLPNLRAAMTSTLRASAAGGGYAGAGVYAIQARHSGKVLDINIDWFSGQQNGRPLGQFENVNWDNQKFRVEPLPNGFVRFIALHSSKCLTAFSTNAGTGLQQWDCAAGNDNQQFAIEPVGDFYRIKVKNSGLYLDVAGAALNNGARVIQWYLNSGDNQLFRFIGTR